MNISEIIERAIGPVSTELLAEVKKSEQRYAEHEQDAGSTDYSIKDLYKRTMSALMADYGKVLHTTMVHSNRYDVTIERTPNFTILWDGIDAMILLALYDWNNHIALDLSAKADGFRCIIESFFWFADKVISVPAEVITCRE